MKTVVTDLDGTLLYHGRIDQISIEVLREFQKVNRLILATGRNLESVMPICESLGMQEFHTGGLILVNGLEIFDFQDGQHRTPDCVFGYISEEELLEIMKVLRPFGMRLRAVRADYGVQKVEMVLPIFGKWITGYLRSVLKEYTVLQIGRNWVEVLPKGTDKLNGLKYFTEKYQIPSNELYVFGDGENDVEMLRYTQNSFSPENALPAAKKAARNICGPCRAYGTVQKIKEIMEKG